MPLTRPSTSPSLLRDPVFRRLWATVELSFLGGFVHVVASAWLISLMSDNATMVALTQTAYGLPMVIFSIFAGAMADTHDRRKTMIWALGFSIFASALLAVAAGFGLLGSWSTLTLLFLVGIGVAIFTPSWQASLGTIVDRDRLGEAVSLHNMGANVMRTVGPALGGFLVTFTSATFTFWWGHLALAVSAIAMSLTWLLALRFPLPETRNLILEPMEKRDLSIVPTLIEPQAGPVQIMVEHRVAEGQLPEFHRLMGLRRRHLIQLGARHWTLLDPLDGGTWWIESFQFPTWADYQRLLQRRTTETVSLREEIRAVQYGKVDPVMRRFMIRGAGPARDALMPRL